MWGNMLKYVAKAYSSTHLWSLLSHNYPAFLIKKTGPETRADLRDKWRIKEIIQTHREAAFEKDIAIIICYKLTDQ